MVCETISVPSLIILVLSMNYAVTTIVYFKTCYLIMVCETISVPYLTRKKNYAGVISTKVASRTCHWLPQDSMQKIIELI